MQFSQNKVFLIGNATKDPELRYTPNGHAVATFSLATSRGVKKNDQWEDETTFHNIVCWTKLAEIVAERLRKGQFCTVEGRIQNRKYEKDGITRYISEIVAESVYFKAPKSESASQPAPSAPEDEPSPETMSGNEETVDPDDIPF